MSFMKMSGNNEKKHVACARTWARVLARWHHRSFDVHSMQWSLAAVFTLQHVCAHVTSQDLLAHKNERRQNRFLRKIDPTTVSSCAADAQRALSKLASLRSHLSMFARMQRLRTCSRTKMNVRIVFYARKIES